MRRDHTFFPRVVTVLDTRHRAVKSLYRVHRDRSKCSLAVLNWYSTPILVEGILSALPRATTDRGIETYSFGVLFLPEQLESERLVRHLEGRGARKIV